MERERFKAVLAEQRRRRSTTMASLPAVGSTVGVGYIKYKVLAIVDQARGLLRVKNVTSGEEKTIDVEDVDRIGSGFGKMALPPLGEKQGKVVLVGGKWFWSKPNDSLRYGPFDSASAAADAARSKGVDVG
jgi:hypothetical protein